MGDLSDARPIKGDRWANSRHPERRCVAHKKNGDQCGNAARRGTNVCDYHGAKAPQVQRRAQQRLEEAADRMAKELLSMAINPDVADSVKLSAIRDALDRGLGIKTAVELSAKPREPWQEVFDGIATISRAESRALDALRNGELVGAARELEVVDAEITSEASDEEGTERAVLPPVGELRTLDRAALPSGESAAPTAPVALPPTPISYEEAADVMRSSRLRTNPGRGKGRRR
jgi:hypothetical protein